MGPQREEGAARTGCVVAGGPSTSAVATEHLRAPRLEQHGAAAGGAALQRVRERLATHELQHVDHGK